MSICGACESASPTMASFRLTYSPEDVCKFVKDQFPAISEAVMDEITSHDVDGETFIALDDENLKEIAPKLCDRVKMKKAVQMALNGTSPVSFHYTYM